MQKAPPKQSFLSVFIFNRLFSCSVIVKGSFKRYLGWENWYNQNSALYRHNYRANYSDHLLTAVVEKNLCYYRGKKSCKPEYKPQPAAVPVCKPPRFVIFHRAWRPVPEKGVYLLRAFYPHQKPCSYHNYRNQQVAYKHKPPKWHKQFPFFANQHRWCASK